MPHVFITASRSIKKGTEILYDYEYAMRLWEEHHRRIHLREQPPEDPQTFDEILAAMTPKAERSFDQFQVFVAFEILTLGRFLDALFHACTSFKVTHVTN